MNESPFEMDTPRRGRLSGTDSTMTALTKLAEGNPGSLRVMMEMLQKRDWKSPAGNGFLFIMSFDDWGLYGGSIWCLWKDCCREDWLTFETVLLNRIRGHIRQTDFMDHIGDGRGYGKPFENLKTIEEMFPSSPEDGKRPDVGGQAVAEDVPADFNDINLVDRQSIDE